MEQDTFQQQYNNKINLNNKKLENFQNTFVKKFN